MKKYARIITSALASVVLLSSTTVLSNAKTISQFITDSDCDLKAVICSLQENCQNSENIKELLKDNDCIEINKLSECFTVYCGQFTLPNCNTPCESTEPTEPVTSDATEAADTTTKPEPTTTTVTEPTITEPAEEESSTQPTAAATQPQTTTAPQSTTPHTTAPAATEAEQITTAPSTSQNNYNESYADEVIRLVNIEREKAGLEPLSKRQDVTEIAEIRAVEITQLFSHTRPNGSSCFSLASEKNISYKSVGENIAYGYSTPEAVVQGWMNSSGHRANILSSSFNGIGVGCYNKNGTLYWTQFFIGA